jgi:hypothetical protein
MNAALTTLPALGVLASGLTVAAAGLILSIVFVVLNDRRQARAVRAIGEQTPAHFQGHRPGDFPIIGDPLWRL